MAKESTEGNAPRDGVSIVVRAQGEDRPASTAEILAEADRIRAEEQAAQLTKGELLDKAEELNVSVPSNAAKGDLVEIVASRGTGLPVGAVRFEGTPHEIQGPGPEWEKDGEGNYVNR